MNKEKYGMSLYETVLLMAVSVTAAFVAVILVLGSAAPYVSPVPDVPVRPENPSAVFAVQGEDDMILTADGLMAENGIVTYTGSIREKGMQTPPERAVVTDTGTCTEIRFDNTKRKAIRLSGSAVRHIS